jgi:hypothetical protein
MDISKVLTTEHSAAPAAKRARTDGTEDQSVIAAAAVAVTGPVEDEASPYTDLQRSVHAALESKEGPSLTTSDKVALALEVLRARQLELDLAQARNNIEALVTKTGSAPRTVRSIVPASCVKGLPVGAPIDIQRGKFLLSPTTNDPQALFLTLELQHFGQPQASSEVPGLDDAKRDATEPEPAQSGTTPGGTAERADAKGETHA